MLLILLHEHRCFFGLLDNLLQIFIAIFEDKILSSFTVLTSRVVNVKHFDDIFALSESIKHLVFSADVLASLLSPLHCDRLI